MWKTVVRKILVLIISWLILFVSLPSTGTFFGNKVYGENTEIIHEPTFIDEFGHSTPHENWWFSGIVVINQSRYSFIVSFHKEYAYFLFSKAGETAMYSRYWNSANHGLLQVLNQSDEIVTLQMGEASATLRPPNVRTVYVEGGQVSLNLIFESRGTPFWYAKGGAARVTANSTVSGYEDLSNIKGHLTINSNLNSAVGSGLFEHAWGNVRFSEIAKEDWIPVNFDNLYALLFSVTDIYGNVYKDGGIYIIAEQSYYIVNNLQISHLGDESPPRDISITASTDSGTLTIRGSIIGSMDNGHENQYVFNGTFTYLNGTPLLLVNGLGWNEFVSKPGIGPEIFNSTKIIGVFLIVIVTVFAIYVVYRRTKSVSKGQV